MAPPHGPGHTDASRGRAGQDVLLAAQGHTNVEITRRPDTTERSVSKRRRRWCEEGPAGSDERPRPGRPRPLPAAQVAEIKALVCELPAESGRPLSRWSHAETAREAAARRIVSEISGITVWRNPAANAIRSTEAWRNSRGGIYDEQHSGDRLRETRRRRRPVLRRRERSAMQVLAM